MGLKLAELFVTISGNDRPLRSTLSGVRAGLLGLKGVAAAAGTAIAGAGLAAGLASVISTATKMEDKLAALSKATDLEGAALDQLKKELFALSTNLKGVKLDSLLDIAIAGAKLGVATDELVRYTEGIAKVSTAIDDLPAGEITDQIGKLNVVFKLGVQGALQLGSAIDRVADSGASSASGILNVSQRISGTAKGAKVTAQETIALAGALLDTGSEAEAASGALMRLIDALNDADAQKGFARTIGTDAGRFAKAVETRPVEAIFSFLDALKRLDAASQNQALEAIGLDSSIVGGQIKKLAEQVDNARRYTRMANEEFATLNQINKSYAATARLTSAEIERQRNAFQILSVDLGNALLPATNTALSLAGDLVAGLSQAFNQSRSDASAWGVDVSGQVDTLGATFRNIGPVVRYAMVSVVEFGANVVDVLAWLWGVLKGTAVSIGQVLTKMFSLGILAALNFMETAKSAISEVWDYIASMGKDPIEIKVKPVLEGREAIDEQLKVEGPKWDALNLTNLDFQRQAIMEEMVGNELATARVKADAAAKRDGAGPKKAPAAKDEAGKSLAGDAKGHAQTTDLDGFRRSLQEGVYGKDKAAKDTAANTLRIAVAAEKLAGREPGPMVGLAGA